MSFCKASFDVLDESHNPVLKLEGPCAIFDGIFHKTNNKFVKSDD